MAATRAALGTRPPDPVARGRALLAAASEIETRRPEFVALLRTAHGLRISEAVEAVDACIDTVVRWAGWADKLDLLVAGVRPGQRPAPCAILAPAGFVASTTAACSILAAGGSAVLAHDSTAVDVLVTVLAQEFPPGSLALVPRDAESVRTLARTLPVLDARGAGAEFDADVRRVCARSGTRVLPPRKGDSAGDLEHVTPLYAEPVTAV